MPVSSCCAVGIIIFRQDKEQGMARSKKKKIWEQRMCANGLPSFGFFFLSVAVAQRWKLEFISKNKTYLIRDQTQIHIIVHR